MGADFQDYDGDGRPDVGVDRVLEIREPAAH